MVNSNLRECVEPLKVYVGSAGSNKKMDCITLSICIPAIKNKDYLENGSELVW